MRPPSPHRELALLNRPKLYAHCTIFVYIYAAGCLALHPAAPLRLTPGLVRSIKAFKATNQEDVSTIYLCPFCKGQARLAKLSFCALLPYAPQRLSRFLPSACSASRDAACAPARQGTANCFDCRGKAKLWPQRLNLSRMFKLRHVNQARAFPEHPTGGKRAGRCSAPAVRFVSSLSLLPTALLHVAPGLCRACSTPVIDSCCQLLSC